MLISQETIEKCLGLAESCQLLQLFLEHLLPLHYQTPHLLLLYQFCFAFTSYGLRGKVHTLVLRRLVLTRPVSFLTSGHVWLSIRIRQLLSQLREFCFLYWHVILRNPVSCHEMLQLSHIPSGHISRIILFFHWIWLMKHSVAEDCSNFLVETHFLIKPVP